MDSTECLINIGICIICVHFFKGNIKTILAFSVFKEFRNRMKWEVIYYKLYSSNSYRIFYLFLVNIKWEPCPYAFLTNNLDKYF